jgi:hypothetical protein
VVFLDVGHGGYDPGGVGPDGLPESFVNLAVADKLASELRDKGIGAKHFAQVLENDVAKEIGLSNDGVMKDDLYVIKNTKSSMPDVLIEYAYISNLHEEKLLSNSAFLDRIAGAAARAIERYFAVQTPGTFVHAVSPEEKSSLARISSVLPTNGTLELESSSPPSVRISPSSVPGKIENQPEVLNFRTCIGR